MTTVDLVYFNAGGGHRNAALALQEVIHEQQRPWCTRLVNLTEVLDPTAAFNRLIGVPPEAFYNIRLARGWTLGLKQQLKLLQAAIRFAHSAFVRALERHWVKTRPDLVVSLVPNFNRALYASVTSALREVPFVTVLTDMADLPPHFWIEPDQQQHLVCGTRRAVEQAKDAGYSDNQISLTSGMILRPAVYRSRGDRAELRCELGLDAQLPTAVVSFGAHGSMSMLTIAKALPNLQLVLLCGHNKILAERLRALPAVLPRAIVEFTADIGRYYAVGDMFIGKPGPGSLSEAVQMQLPVITFQNAWTMPQERYNTQWIREHGIGIVVESLGTLPDATAELLRRMHEFRERVGALDNRAVFEVPAIFQALLDAAHSPSIVAPRAALAS